jgi:hypothetical protein
MKYKQPKRTILEEDEIERTNTIRTAKYFQIAPHETGDIPEGMYLDALEVQWFEDMVSKEKNEKQKAAQRLARARKRRR